MAMRFFHLPSPIKNGHPCSRPKQVTRRQFLRATLIAGGLFWAEPKWPQSLDPHHWPLSGGVPFPVQFRKPNPYEALFRHVEPGQDEFVAEKYALEITSHLNRLPSVRSFPLAADFQGISPLPADYSSVGVGVSKGIFDLSDSRFQAGLQRWL